MNTKELLMRNSRIASAIDVEKTSQAIVGGVGVGGSADFYCDLARCGVQRFRIIDPQRIETSNVARQGHDETNIGMAKVKAVAKKIKAINPRAEVLYEVIDFTQMTEPAMDAFFAAANLLVFMTDSFAAQALGNALALRQGIPALWAGLYAGGMGGEIAFWHHKLDACFRCLVSLRYKAHEAAKATGKSLDPVSDGATIFDIHFLDAIAGMLAIGLLTMGSQNRFGQLIEKLGNRNFLSISLDPDYRLRGKDPIRDILGIDPSNPAYFAWNTAIRSDPTADSEPCPDCVRFRGHRWEPAGETGLLRRVRPGDEEIKSDKKPGHELHEMIDTF